MARKKTAAPAPEPAQAPEEPGPDELLPQELKFCLALWAGKNKQQAAAAAGFDKKNAPFGASRMLQRPRVKAYLQSLYKRDEDEAAIDRERIRARLLGMALADPSDAFEEDWEMKPKSRWPKALRFLLVGIKKWDGEQGTSISSKISTPLDAMKAYLRFFPEVAQKAADLSEAAEKVQINWEELITRLETKSKANT